MSKMQRINALLMIILILAACSMVQGCDSATHTEKGANIPMQTYYIGRFSLAVPVEMKMDERTSELSYAKIKEVIWPKAVSHEHDRNSEWKNFMAEINKLTPPEGKDKVIIRMRDFPGLGQWARGVFYFDNYIHPRTATWAILMDSGQVGVWFRCGPTLVVDEFDTNRVANNISITGKAYRVMNQDSPKALLKDDWFHLEYGAINLAYEEQEESHARFEGHPLNLVITIKMEMDIGYWRETMGLIEKTKGMLAAAALETGGSITKIRLAKREVAGMKGEESILRISEDGEKTLMFAWEFNGKEDSGEYPTTTIEMEAPDGKLDEKTKIWDAVLDSMKPMFEGKK